MGKRSLPLLLSERRCHLFLYFRRPCSYCSLFTFVWVPSRVPPPMVAMSLHSNMNSFLLVQISQLPHGTTSVDVHPTMKHSIFIGVYGPVRIPPVSVLYRQYPFAYGSSHLEASHLVCSLSRPFDLRQHLTVSAEQHRSRAKFLTLVRGPPLPNIDGGLYESLESLPLVVLCVPHLPSSFG
jgi:hypothetical protein